MQLLSASWGNRMKHHRSAVTARLSGSDMIHHGRVLSQEALNSHLTWISSCIHAFILFHQLEAPAPVGTQGCAPNSPLRLLLLECRTLPVTTCHSPTPLHTGHAPACFAPTPCKRHTTVPLSTALKAPDHLVRPSIPIARNPGVATLNSPPAPLHCTPRPCSNRPHPTQVQ